MNAEAKARWITALRGGQYPQGKSYLRTEDGYCCLGVLCDLVNPQGWGAKVESGTGVLAFLYGNPDPENKLMKMPIYYLPQAIGDELDIQYEDILALSRMNDGGRSFNEIADWIDRNL